MGHKHCSEAPHTRGAGRYCNGWSSMTAEECRLKCEANRLPDGCPADHRARPFVCTHFVHYPLRQNWCHLFDKCTLAPQSKGSLLYALNRPPGSPPPAPAAASPAEDQTTASQEATGAGAGHHNGKHHGGKYQPSPPLTPPASPPPTITAASPVVDPADEEKDAHNPGHHIGKHHGGSN